MIFLLFLASVATIEVILNRDEAKQRKIKPPSAGVNHTVALKPMGESVLALKNTLDQHGRGSVPTVDIEVATSNEEHRAWL